MAAAVSAEAAPFNLLIKKQHSSSIIFSANFLRYDIFSVYIIV